MPEIGYDRASTAVFNKGPKFVTRLSIQPVTKLNTQTKNIKQRERERERASEGNFFSFTSDNKK